MSGESVEVKAAAVRAPALDTFAEGWGEFVKARAEFAPIALDRVNPHFKSKYASLASVLSAVIPALTKHGLAVTTVMRDDGGRLVAETQVVYRGVTLAASAMPIAAAAGASAQAVGSALTYARRYAICALLGVVAEDDDDGNAAEAAAGRTAAPAPF